MSDQIIGLHDWLQTPAGRYLLDWERARLDAAVVDIFGYHALQLGVPELDGLQANRMPHRWLATEQVQIGEKMSAQQPAMLCDYSAPAIFGQQSGPGSAAPHTGVQRGPSRDPARG